MQTAAALRKAALYIKKGFTKGACARNAGGWAVPIQDKTACSFCILGAISKVVQDDAHPAFNYADNQLRLKEISGAAFLSTWNDQRERTKEDVVNFLRACANKLETD